MTIAASTSPDGSRLAAHRHLGNQGGDLWVTQLARGTTSRFTLDASQESVSPVWSPDAGAIAFGSSRGAKSGIYRKSANGDGAEERLLESDTAVLPISWSPDGRSIVYHGNAAMAFNLFWLPLDGDRRPAALAATTFTELFGQVSPDGHWLAYRGNETSVGEICVRPYVNGSAKWQISSGGGHYPRWRRDGQELYYMSNISSGKMMAVGVKSGATIDFGVPQPLFDSNDINLPHNSPYHPWAVAADGQRFLIPRPTSTAPAELASPPIVVVLNWTQGIGK